MMMARLSEDSGDGIQACGKVRSSFPPEGKPLWTRRAGACGRFLWKGRGKGAGSRFPWAFHGKSINCFRPALRRACEASAEGSDGEHNCPSAVE